MHFQLPYGPLRWVILVWLAGAVLAIALVFGTGNPSAIGIPLFTLIMSVCICLGSRGCAWAMLVLCVIGLILLPVRTLLADEPANWLRVIFKMGVRVWFIWALHRWLSHDYYYGGADTDDEGEEDAVEG